MSKSPEPTFLPAPSSERRSRPPTTMRSISPIQDALATSSGTTCRTSSGCGIGRHFCAGAPLARVAARAALETLYERIPSLRIPEQELGFAVALSRQYEMLIAEWD